MSDRTAKLVSVNISERNGEKKHNVDNCQVSVDHGLDGDAHAGPGHRQVSLLAVESIDKMRLAGADVWPGDFAENLTTQGIEIMSLPVGARLSVGGSIILEITQIGKTCTKVCAIRDLLGDCVLPREGVFARVVAGGEARVGDDVRVLDEGGKS